MIIVIIVVKGGCNIGKSIIISQVYKDLLNKGYCQMSSMFRDLSSGDFIDVVIHQ